MRLGRPRAFGALLSPTGIHAVEYRMGRAGPRIVRSTWDPTRGNDPAAAATRLADLLESMGGRGGRVAVSVSGFGAYHHIFSLPPAPREVLLPVVGREMRRFYPALFATGQPDPILDLVEIDGDGAPSGARTREVLAAGVPRSLVETVAATLRARGIVLEHWTILPRVAQRVYDWFATGDRPSALLLMVPQGPLLGFFLDGELRLFSEAQIAADDEGTEVETAVEQLTRGALYLRQQFRGSSVERVLVAAETAEERLRVAAELQARVDIPLESVGPYSEAPGALAALGAALDAASEQPLDLLPAELRPPSAQQRRNRTLAVAASLLLVLAPAGWAWSAARAESRAEERLLALQDGLRPRLERLAAMRPVVEARRDHARRVALLAALAEDRERLPELLWPLQADDRVRVDSLHLSRAAGGWTGKLLGTATASTSAGATAVVDGVYRELARTFPENSVSLSRLANVERAPGPEGERPEGVALSFEIVFVVPGAPPEGT